MAAAAERKRLRGDSYLHTLACVPVQFRRPGAFKRADVLIRRISPRKYDSDGWIAAAKPLRDGIADALGLPDNDPRIVWSYDQDQGMPREYCVRFFITFEV